MSEGFEMTFSILGCCPRHGQSGVTMATLSIAIGSRCPFVRKGVGETSTQKPSYPRLGPALLDQMEAGQKPKVAISNLLADDTIPIAMVDGFSAHQGTHLADNLLAGLISGLATGGEEGEVHSAALLVGADQD